MAKTLKKKRKVLRGLPPPSASWDFKMGYRLAIIQIAKRLNMDTEVG